jgi:hypothetical protein
MRHRCGRGVVGLVAGLAAICLLSLPAAANTGTVDFVNLTGTTPGNITIYDANEEIVTSIAIPGTTGLTCSTDPGGITVTTTGSTSGDITIVFTNKCNAFALFGQWCSYMSGTLTGTYTYITTGVGASLHTYSRGLVLHAVRSSASTTARSASTPRCTS